ncbi:hypothetical protein VPH35_096942 [Triticum aestivum]
MGLLEQARQGCYLFSPAALKKQISFLTQKKTRKKSCNCSRKREKRSNLSLSSAIPSSDAVLFPQPSPSIAEIGLRFPDRRSRRRSSPPHHALDFRGEG